MRIPTWLQLVIVLALALASWISALDATGSQAESSVLWTLTAIAVALLVVRLLRRAY